jgi:hypothetical protein
MCWRFIERVVWHVWYSDVWIRVGIVRFWQFQCDH